ncbi:YlxR family protein [Capillimicrobium parvum]|uniref:YlxR family protein n=1 Tax=Capillimicrobium parvum TaxID=2884022 RepID=UPI003898FBB3
MGRADRRGGGILTAPVRRCAGCGERAPQRDLLRLALVEGRAVFDRDRRLGGRGAYVHPDPACLERASRRGGFARAFRARVTSAPQALDSD